MFKLATPIQSTSPPITCFAPAGHTSIRPVGATMELAYMLESTSVVGDWSLMKKKKMAYTTCHARSFELHAGTGQAHE